MNLNDRKFFFKRALLFFSLIGLICSSMVAVRGDPIFETGAAANFLVFSWIFSPFYLSTMSLYLTDHDRLFYQMLTKNIMLSLSAQLIWIVLAIIWQFGNADPVFAYGLLISPLPAFGVSGLIGFVQLSLEFLNKDSAAKKKSKT